MKATSTADASPWLRHDHLLSRPAEPMDGHHGDHQIPSTEVSQSLPRHREIADTPARHLLKTLRWGASRPSGNGTRVVDADGRRGLALHEFAWSTEDRHSPVGGRGMSEKKRVIVLEELAPEGLELLSSEGLEVDLGVGWDEGELLRRIVGHHALIVGPAQAVTAATLRAGADLQVVGRIGASVANVDVAEATRRGIVVVDTPQSNAISAAEQALALVLACARDLAGTHADLRAGRWEPEAWARSGVELRGRTLGIVGPGQVAPLLSEAALALGMNVLTAADDPERLYAEADFILVDLRGDPQPGELVGEAEFARMKHGVRVISLAPAGVVDPAAWAAAIAGGKVVSSAATVHAGDPPLSGALAAHERVLLAPHLEESTLDARLRAGLMIAEQVAAVLRGEFASSAVNVPVTLVDDADELMPYLGLCAQLGRLLVGLAGGSVEEVEISYGGSFAFFDTRILTLGVLGGVLADQVEGRVNYVNVQSIAEARGVSARETKQSDLPDFPRLITVSTCGPGGLVSVSGTSLGPEHKSRLVRVFGEDIDIDPAPHMLFLRYVDAPGVGGAVGTMLGEWGVNIRHMSVGRGTAQRESVMALTLDEPLDADQLEQLVARCALAFGKGVEL
jgi:D-3-phosphoglycerate dehydrogenase